MLLWRVNYQPQAAVLADELEKLPSAEINLTVGRGGFFHVTIDNRIVYSKFKTGNSRSRAR